MPLQPDTLITIYSKDPAAEDMVLAWNHPRITFLHGTIMVTDRETGQQVVKLKADTGDFSAFRIGY